MFDREPLDRSECVPSYSKCLDLSARDYDCQDADESEGGGDGPRYTSGPIAITGEDPFDLDPDGNGFGCA